MKTIFTITAVSILLQLTALGSSITRYGAVGGGHITATASTGIFPSNSSTEDTPIESLPSGAFIEYADNPSGPPYNYPTAHASSEIGWSDELLQTSVSGSIGMANILTGYIGNSNASASGNYQYVISITEPTTFNFQIHTGVVVTAGVSVDGATIGASLLQPGVAYLFYYHADVDGTDYSTSIPLNVGDYQLTVISNLLYSGTSAGEINSGVTFSASVSDVPEPSTYAMLAMGGATLLFQMRRRK